ncbi:MAG: PaaI family thioesterase [Acidimicrobiia bacterium]|jgi:acyl-coenzyme A thioesterase PaaI-like protein|nr:PaaI family thioesterase [Acidimicrobiia bacterium]MBP8182261.1 PaaI family thioesterase [Acidimicrobiia bacterium]
MSDHTEDRAQALPNDPVDMDQARAEVAEAARRAIAHLNEAPQTEADLKRATALFEEVASLLDRGQALGPKQWRTDKQPGFDTFFRFDPFMGRYNPIAPPAHLHFDGAEVRGTVTCSAAYEGPPGHVHGGIVAGIFDQLLGFANCSLEHLGMTARLEVDYRAPTPLMTELSLAARRQSLDGRKLFVEGTISVGDTITARALGLFVQPRPGMLADAVVPRTQGPAGT